MKNPEIIMEISHLYKIFGKGHTSVKALDDISLHLEKGELILIMGPSGSGKSTLLQIIGALLKPTEGEVIVEGMNYNSISERKKAEIRLRTFGFIFQSPNLLTALTALQNIELVLKLGGLKSKKRKELAVKLLEKLSLGHRIHHKPSKLSGGEQQRVAIARALANNPSIILADEPTANLDSKSGYNIVKILRSIAKEQNKTVLIVSHDTRIKNLADRILWLEDGRLKVQWSPDGTFVDPVCLMVVNPNETEYKIKHQGVTYYFCTEKCKQEFEKNPRIYEFGIKN